MSVSHFALETFLFRQAEPGSRFQAERNFLDVEQQS